MNLDSDPIKSSTEDYLDRSGTTKYISRLIKDTGDSALRIGIFGPWGCGKSSIIQILENEYLSKNEFTFFKFNPWLYSNEDDLISGFNTELFLKFKVKIQGSNYDLLKKGTELVGGILEKVNFDIEKMGTFGVAAGQIGTFLKSLVINKDTIKGIIQNSGKRVVVVIEDIDRCDPEVIKPFLLYIREVLNFDKSVTILVSDLSSINKSFEESSNLQGFFEKIYDYPVFLENLKPDLSANFILKNSFCPYPKQFVEKHSSLLPDNPRALKKLCRSFKLLKEQTERYYPDDINWNSLFIGQLLAFKYPALVKVFTQNATLFLSIVRPSLMSNNDRRSEEEKLIEVEKNLKEAVLEAASPSATESEIKSFVADLVFLYKSDKFYISSDLERYVSFVTDPPMVTRKEIESVLKKDLDNLTINDVLKYGADKGLSIENILDSLLTIRSSYFSEYLESFFMSNLGVIPKRILSSTQLVYELVNSSERFSNELFAKTVGNFREWGVILRTNGTKTLDELKKVRELEDQFVSEALNLTADTEGLKKISDSYLDSFRGFGDNNPFLDVLREKISQPLEGSVGSSFLEKLSSNPELIADSQFCASYRDAISKESFKAFLENLKDITNKEERSMKIFLFFESWIRRDRTTFFHYIHNWAEVKKEFKDQLDELWKKVDTEHLNPWGEHLWQYMHENAKKSLDLSD